MNKEIVDEIQPLLNDLVAERLAMSFEDQTIQTMTLAHKIKEDTQSLTIHLLIAYRLMQADGLSEEKANLYLAGSIAGVLHQMARRFDDCGVPVPEILKPFFELED